MKIIDEIIYVSNTNDYFTNVFSIVNKNMERDYIIICNTTKVISDVSVKIYMRSCITRAQKQGADILLGGVENFHKILQVEENLFCIEKFQGFNLIILFKSIFKKIIQNQNSFYSSMEDLLIDLADNIFVIHPFIILEDSSDNDNYERSSNIMEDLKQIRKFYNT